MRELHTVTIPFVYIGDIVPILEEPVKAQLPSWVNETKREFGSFKTLGGTRIHLQAGYCITQNKPSLEWTLKRTEDELRKKGKVPKDSVEVIEVGGWWGWRNKEHATHQFDEEINLVKGNVLLTIQTVSDTSKGREEGRRIAHSFASTFFIGRKLPTRHRAGFEGELPSNIHHMWRGDADFKLD